jgi:pimeloyl-ACP methyl ester carboxylesterase
VAGLEEFIIDIPGGVLADLQQRLDATRWTDDFANDDWRYGAHAGYFRTLAAYWREGYDWRARERLMNGFAHFRTQLAGMPIHFIHARGQGPAPMPLILNHGWPWSFWDFNKVIGPLSDPAAHGGDALDAFDVIVPSLPGYGFSTPLRQPGMNWWKTADLWVGLMDKLGYGRFASAGGDWGSFISAQLGHKYAERVIGIHIHTPAPLDFLSGGMFDPADYAPDEEHLINKMLAFRGSETGYFALQTTKPQTPAIALNDSPAGLLAWMVEKRRRWSDCHGDVEARFTKDELLDTVMLYWATQSYNTSARYYYEAAHDPWRPAHERSPCVEAPTAIAIFPGELTFPPRKGAEKYYNLQRWTEMPAGGHFAPAEEPAAWVEDVRAFFRDLR